MYVPLSGSRGHVIGAAEGTHVYQAVECTYATRLDSWIAWLLSEGLFVMSRETSPDMRVMNAGEDFGISAPRTKRA